MINKKRVEEILEDLKVLRYGHFLYTSGKHGEVYMQCARLLENPKYAEEIIQGLAEEFKDGNINLVVGPAIGGITISYEFARQLGVKSLFAEREDDIMKLRRGFKIPKGARVLVVEDVITTGGSVKEVIDLVKGKGGEIAGVAVIVDRTGGKIDFGSKFVSAYSREIKAYDADSCPLCKDGEIPLERLGSRKIN